MVQQATSKKTPLKIALLSLGAFVLLFAIASMIVIKIVYNEHFQRVQRPQFSGRFRPSDVAGYDRKIVHFNSGGNTLTGYLYGRNGTKGLAVISHGLGFGADDYLGQILFFVGQGWRVFAFDDTGTYASEGKSTVGLPQAALDLNAALAYVKNDPELQGMPVVLFGHSWGGYAVAAVLNYHPDVAAAASVSGFNSPMGLFNEQMRNMIGPFASLEYPFEWIYQEALFGRAAGLTAVAGINGSSTPVMIVHGTADEAISYSGASIIAQRNRITNPNVVYRTVSTPNGNGHNTVLRSEAARQYAAIENREYRALYKRYHGKIPRDVRARFYANVDRFKVNEPDPDLMNAVESFFERGVADRSHPS